MKKFHSLIYSQHSNLMTVQIYEMGDFDLRQIWRSKILTEPLPETVRFYVDFKDSLPTDYVANPTSWPICSERMTAFLVKRSPDCIQVIDAPLFEVGTNERVNGYKIINVIRLISCLDLDNSRYKSWNKSTGTVQNLNHTVIKSEQVPDNTHIFRIKEYFTDIYFSDELAHDFDYQGLSGFAFMKHQSSYHGSLSDEV
jgi:hypothetical protein